MRHLFTQRACAHLTAVFLLAARLHGQALPDSLTAGAGVVALDAASIGGSADARAREVQFALGKEMEQRWKARATPALPGWSAVLRATERQTGLLWRGPSVVVLSVPDVGAGFACPEGRCDGRFEGVRIVATNGAVTDTMVVGVILIAESALLSQEVWQHEITHALLAQHGLIEESLRHDRRYFALARGTVAARTR